jgi:gliding motility-associated lipoprotein GldH
MKVIQGSHRWIWIFAITVLTLAGCRQNHVYEKYKTIPDYIWNYYYRVPFEFNITDTVSYYNVFINIRNAGIYPYSNIWLIVNQQTPGGLITRKRYEFILANPDGSWKGNGLGDIWDNRFIMEEHVRFRTPGEYTYTFQHSMRMDNLPAIMDIGMEVIKDSD